MMMMMMMKYLGKDPDTLSTGDLSLIRDVMLIYDRSMLNWIRRSRNAR